MSHRVHHLYGYHVWASDQLFDHLEQLPSGVFHAEVTSVFPSVSQTLGHMYLVDQLYLAVLAKVANEEIFPKMAAWEEEAQGKSVSEMRLLFADVHKQYIDLLQRTSDPDMAITISHPKRGSMATTFFDMIQHVVNHGTYHRGNVTAMLRQQGVAGVPTDYLFYLLAEQKGER